MSFSTRRALLSAAGVLLALSFLAPRATADDSPPQPPADFESFVDFVRSETEKSEKAGAGSNAGPSCGSQDAYVASVSLRKQLEAQILELRNRAQGADRQGGPKLLNGSGYNYRPTVLSTR